MSNITKQGNIISDNIYEYKAMSIFCDSNGTPLQNSVSYIPSTGVNSCMPQRTISVETNVKYFIECTVFWSGFDTSNTSGTFNAWFQGSQNGGWNYGNAMTNALNNYKNLKELVLSATTGSYKYVTSFIVTNSEIKTLGLSTRFDYSNGKGSVGISDVIIIPEKYYISDKIKMRLANDYITCNEIWEI